MTLLFRSMLLSLSLLVMLVHAQDCTDSSTGRTGTCMDVSDCQGTTKRGLCPGSSRIRCCFPIEESTTTTTTQQQEQQTQQQSTASPVVVAADGPSTFFMFASSGKGVSPSDIRAASRKNGNPIMVGFDAGNIMDNSLAAAKEVGAQLHIYVEGPGGPTGEAWSPDELERVRKGAASVGITGSDWMKRWDAGGWKTYTMKQLAGYKAQGYVSAEIDNLERVLGGSSSAILAFYREYADAVAAGRVPRLVMKNIDADRMKDVVAAVKSGNLPRSMFSEYHIAEKDTDNRAGSARLSTQIAIRTLNSDNTFAYDAFGVYGLQSTWSQFFPGGAAPAASVRAGGVAPAPSSQGGGALSDWAVGLIAGVLGTLFILAVVMVVLVVVRRRQQQQQGESSPWSSDPQQSLLSTSQRAILRRNSQRKSQGELSIV